MAAPMLRAQRAGGRAAVSALIAQVISSIRSICLLTGCATARDLAAAPRHLGAPLRGFLDDLELGIR
jgi:isopentenyl diphosphate isomerase/L-lactate dehydrogenase-like FMN-dependent dehydrogenase